MSTPSPEHLRHRQSIDRRIGLTPRRWHYPLLGILLALGAPAGLLLSHSIADGIFPTGTWALNELSAHPLTYGYVAISTVLLLVVLGYWLGRKTDHLSLLSNTDPLTGLFNRRYFTERLEEEINRSTRYGMPLSMITVDLDSLKRINDYLGHKVGDSALVAVATDLLKTVRAIDISARVGGDEFIVFFPQTTAIAAAKQANRFKIALARRSGTWGSPLSVSVGVAEFDPTLKAPGEKFLLAADHALYEAKAAGGGQTIVAQPRPSNLANAG